MIGGDTVHYTNLTMNTNLQQAQPAKPPAMLSGRCVESPGMKSHVVMCFHRVVAFMFVSQTKGTQVQTRWKQSLLQMFWFNKLLNVKVSVSYLKVFHDY